MVEEKQVYHCPFCESKISKEQYDKVIQENELLKKKARELEEEIRLLKIKEAKLQEKIKEAVAKERKNSEKLREENRQLKVREAKFKEQIKDVRKQERQKYGEKLERDSRLIEKLKQENDLLKKGITPQEAGFEFEKNMHGWLEAKFKPRGDNIEKTGKGKGDSLLRVMNKGKEVGIILVECKKEDKHKSANVEQVKRDKLMTKANVGVLVTNGFFGVKTKMDGFKNIDGVLVIRPHSALEFIELLREHIVEIDYLKISEEEKNKELAKLWRFIHSPEFELQMNAILQNVNKLKELDIDETKILEKRSKIEDDILKAHKLILEGINRTRKNESHSIIS